MGYCLNHNSTVQLPDDKMWAMYYYDYRYYDPDMVQWLNRDPIGQRGGVNLYGEKGVSLRKTVGFREWLSR